MNVGILRAIGVVLKGWTTCVRNVGAWLSPAETPGAWTSPAKAAATWTNGAETAEAWTKCGYVFYGTRIPYGTVTRLYGVGGSGRTPTTWAYEALGG